MSLSNENRLRKVSFSSFHNNNNNNNTNNSNGGGSNPTASAYNNNISPIDEQFISQIVMTSTPLEQALSNVLKSVFTAGRAEAFMGTLSDWSSRKEREIESVCAEGYALFVPTVESILGKVRENGGQLEMKMKKLQEEISSSGQEIYDTRVERFEARKMLLNVGRSIRAVEDCLKALNLLLMIKLEIKDGNFHSAVKLIDELQGKGILRVIEEEISVSIYKKLNESLDMSKKKVLEAAIGQVKSWLASVRDESIVMGSLALSQVQARYEQYERSRTQNRNISFDLYLSNWATEDVEMITSNDLIKVDFVPLQKTLRLFSMIDKTGEFCELLVETRKIQLDLIMSTRINFELPDSDPKSLKSFLNSLVGFFIFEHLLARQNPNQIYPLAQLEARWEAAQVKIKEIALDSLKRLGPSDRSAFMKIKWQLIFFSNCMEMFEYPNAQLIEIILFLFYRYIDLLRQDLLETIDKFSYSGSVNTMIPLNSQITTTLPLFTSDRLEISSLFWNWVLLLKNSFLTSFKIFLQGLPSTSSRLNDFYHMARRTVDDQLLPAMARCLLKQIKSVATKYSLEQKVYLLQVLYDFKMATQDNGDLVRIVLYLESDTETLTCNEVQNPITGSSSSQLASTNIFESCIQNAQQEILSDANITLDELLTKIQEQHHQHHDQKFESSTPTTQMQDMVRFLKSFKRNTDTYNDINLAFYLPLVTRIINYFDTKIFSDIKFSQISACFLKNVAVDLKYLREFIVKELEVRPLKPFLDCIAGPLEMCDLIEAETVHEFLDPVVRKQKYPNLESKRIISVLGKIKEPADKRQSVEDLILLLQ